MENIATRSAPPPVRRRLAAQRARVRSDAPLRESIDPHRRPLRILLLNERCHRNPLAGGAEVHLFEIFSRLAERGVSVELLCSGYAGAPPHDEHRGVRITRLGARLSSYTQVPREVRRRVAAGEVDLVVEAHNKIPFLAPLYSNVPVLTISASSKTDLIRRGLPEEQIDVVPAGIDHETYRPGPTGPRAPLVVSLGRLEPYKRLDLLLRCWPAVLAAVPGAKLAIVGHGQQGEALAALCTRLGLSTSVTLTGYVTEAEKVSLLQHAALAVQCSRKEGWGLTVTEAYACGTPVVASDVPGLSDSVQDGVTGLLVRAARPAPLAAAISRLLLDEAERVRLGERARLWAGGFRWEESAAAVLRAARAAVRGAVRPTESPEPAVSPARVAASLGADVGVLS